MLFERYFKDSRRNAPYETPEEQLGGLAMLADIYFEHAAAAREAAGIEGALSMAVPRRGGANAELAEDAARGWEHLLGRIEATEWDGKPNFLKRLLDGLYTDEAERLCLLFAAAAVQDRRYERTLAELQDNEREIYPTLSLVLAMCRLSGARATLEECLELPKSGAAWDLIFESDGVGLATLFRLREQVFSAMLGYSSVDRSIEGVAEAYLPGEDGLAPLAIRQDICETLSERYRESFENDVPTAILVTGANGSGRSFLIKHFAQMNDTGLLFVHMDEIGEAAFLPAVKTIASCCVAGAFIPVLKYDEQEPSFRALARIHEVFAARGVLFMFVVADAGTLADEIPGRLCFRAALGRPTPVEAAALWQEYASGALAEKMNVDVLASRYRLSPAQTRDVLMLASGAYRDGDDVEKLISETIRECSSGAGMRYCKKETPFFRMEDLVFPESTKLLLRQIIDRIKNDYFVATAWGFGKKYAYGKGISVLFYGRPGTGKSMCAHVLASELGLDLLRVDLSSVMSKYVGETEKNLSDVFREAEKTNTILFFDEADALFSQRTTEMGGANDKYANLETSHLLQKMEEFGGICVLTTNMAMNFDKAFFRRIEYMVNLPFPDTDTREALWRNAFPEQCPIDGSIPFKHIAERLEMSPSEIKSAAKGAAFIAVSEGSGMIRLPHIVESLKQFYSKSGKNLPPLQI